LLLAEGGEAGEEGGVVQGEDGGGEEGGVFGAGGADGEGADGDAGGHLDDGEEGIEAAELAKDGDAEDWEEGLGGDHAGEMSGAASTGDDDLDAAAGCLRGEFCHESGGAMSGDDAGFVRDMEIGEHAGGFAHDFPVTLAPHDDRDFGQCGHSFEGEDIPARARGEERKFEIFRW
jgi:hypothetical protein